VSACRSVQLMKERFLRWSY